jgi:prepilin-type processing-associated H-X9-DG protein
LPTGGEGTDFTHSTTGKTKFASTSPFTLILPYIEQSALYNQFDLSKGYRDTTPVAMTETTTSSNALASQHPIPVYVCPSTPLGYSRDKLGFGALDYFCTVYTDIDPTTGIRNKGLLSSGKPCRAEGALTVTDGANYGGDNTDPANFVAGTRITSVPLSQIKDGTSNTIAIIEDAGRCGPGMGTYETWSTYAETTTANAAADDLALTTSGGVALRGVWRWADPDAAGSGISGPPDAAVDASKGYYTGKVINQHNRRDGGIGTTGNDSWYTNNVGCNDEPFAWHPGGCNCVMADGSVKFLSDSLNSIVLRFMVTRNEGAVTPPSGITYPDPELN